MSIAINSLLKIFLAHWVADFVFQTNEMATNKSKSLTWLSIHIAAYTIVMLFFFPTMPLFVLINGLTHFGIDYFTSKLTSKLWAKGDVHNFFVVIGMDQMFHLVILSITYMELSK